MDPALLRGSTNLLGVGGGGFGTNLLIGQNGQNLYENESVAMDFYFGTKAYLTKKEKEN